MNDKVYIGMSGGVDSSTAAYILKGSGYGVTGVTHVLCGDGHPAVSAKSVCDSLGIPHVVKDLREEFKDAVMEYFVSTYETGFTPNPCVMCNKMIKFPYLFDLAGVNGYVATGHYARVERVGSRYAVKRGLDKRKDQSYVLWSLSQEQLSRTVFPLGELTKKEVREIAQTAGMECAKSKESQDICFIPDGDYRAFIEGYRGKVLEKGKYYYTDGRYLGENDGQISYTLGQGSGLGIALGHRVYVVSKDAAANTVVLGEREDVMKKKVKASSVFFMAADDISSPERLTAKIRYGKTDTAAVVFRSGEDEITAVFDEPVFAPAPGQSLVVYDGDVVVCGGIIK